MKRHLTLLSIALLITSTAAAQPPLFTDSVPAEEFAVRRAKVMEQIGDGAVVIQGAAEYPAYVKFRQNNQFFYLTGVEVPRAILVIDGRAKTSTLFLNPRDERAERSEGPVLTPGPEAEKLTGISTILPREQFAAALDQLGAGGRTIYVPHRPEALGAATPSYTASHARRSLEDPWDGRLSREAAFIERVKQKLPSATIKDLDPIVDAMRVIKSPREIAIVRESTRISGLGIMEAMRSAQPGMHEYELEAIADYVFKRHNAQGIGYYALVATGTNAFWPHYHAAQSRLEDGDMVLMDYAPDFSYYTTDVTRMFPANGTFSPRQREMYGIYLKLYQALMSSIRPGPASEALTEAHAKMTKILETFTFTDPKIKEAATRFVAGYAKPGRTFGHWLGMEAHDVAAPNFDGVYLPGMMLTIEPALTIPDERIYVRLEDAILITANGFENLSGPLPMEMAEIEKVMKEPGLADLWKVVK